MIEVEVSIERKGRWKERKTKTHPIDSSIVSSQPKNTLRRDVVDRPNELVGLGNRRSSTLRTRVVSSSRRRSERRVVTDGRRSRLEQSRNALRSARIVC